MGRPQPLWQKRVVEGPTPTERYKNRTNPVGRRLSPAASVHKLSSPPLCKGRCRRTAAEGLLQSHGTTPQALPRQLPLHRGAESRTNRRAGAIPCLCGIAHLPPTCRGDCRIARIRGASNFASPVQREVPPNGGGGIVTEPRNNPSGAPAPAPLAQGSHLPSSAFSTFPPRFPHCISTRKPRFYGIFPRFPPEKQALFHIRCA